MQSILKISLTPQQVKILVSEKQIFRSTTFDREKKNVVLCKYLNKWYVLEHDLVKCQYYQHCSTKVLSDAISIYLELLCLYA